MSLPTPAPAMQTAGDALRLARLQRRVGLWILVIALAGWTALAWLVFDMGHPLARLTMPMAADWDAAHWAAVGVMWAVMMAAMMLPSALPMILGFSELSARQGEPRRWRAFVLAYVLVWTVFSAAATVLQWMLRAAGWIDPMATSTSATLNAGVLLIAGVYQFSPLKRVCLARCRTPLGFLIGEWRPGARGAFTMGLRHGLFCLGCCWALMVLLFVGGVMNLAWIAALAIAVALEKIAPHGERIALLLGGVLIAAGVWRICSLA